MFFSLVMASSNDCREQRHAADELDFSSIESGSERDAQIRDMVATVVDDAQSIQQRVRRAAAQLPLAARAVADQRAAEDLRAGPGQRREVVEGAGLVRERARQAVKYAVQRDGIEARPFDAADRQQHV